MAKTITKVDVYRNAGPVDRALRAVVGVGLIAAGLASASTSIGFLAALPLIAIPVIVSAITSYCPVYAAFGISTDRKAESIQA